jgi:hypothetical protein
MEMLLIEQISSPVNKVVFVGMYGLVTLKLLGNCADPITYFSKTQTFVRASMHDWCEQLHYDEIFCFK